MITVLHLFRRALYRVGCRLLGDKYRMIRTLRIIRFFYVCRQHCEIYDEGKSTMVCSKCSSVAAGSVQRPEWMGEVWMTVLRGETSQWKRSDCESWPMAPASALPAHTRGIMSRCRCTISRSTAG